MKVPPFLKKRDKIGIVAPAGNIPGGLDDAVKLLESWGLEVIIGKSVSSFFHQFAGNDELRANDLQHMLNDTSIKAVFAARGGYGMVRIIDKIDFSTFENNPKWIIGFSDITVLHSHVQALFGIATVHGQMPLTIPDATKTSLETLRKALFGEDISYQYTSRFENKAGYGEGILTGGNLSILLSISGSTSEVDYRGKILFIEDVGEYYYSIDRMLRMLKRAGKLKDLKGLIVGAFTALKDKEPGFGFSVPEMVIDLVKEYEYPVATDFPAGHIDNNKTLIFGKAVTLRVQEKSVTLNYI
ncbi:S66 peptidase family protein [Albibacterium bauzanense]|uniref:Muramoyltetrapeptide carboxypeptidase n=1 Tax=Albibacterium bauzanense TaxID=653929 RepID=A0A4R1LV37_9SPHI|nr:LD-carboxypeptidase [Albibacterium bauzanense]TCK82722.1 muramoyltetrapeptide carboxypeptidase [Albibacterium bauzanense]